MAWIESHTTLDRHPKLLAFRRRMGWSQNEVVGFLHRFWWTVLEYAPDGVITGLSPEFFAESLGMPLKLTELALRGLEDKEVGFISRRQGELIVHDWLDYTARYLRDSLYRRSPKKWLAAQEAHGLSADCQPTVGRQSAVPDLPDPTYVTGPKKNFEDRLLERYRSESKNGADKHGPANNHEASHDGD